MATASKAFRARAFDANKSMAVFWGHELPDLSECTAGNRAVTLMPSGMEKEEEMESHLQDAILAQQASTSGIQVNHVIPTPKVWPVPSDRYEATYPSRNKHVRSKYIKVHAWQALERDEPEYDYDTEDEEWLSDHPHIEPKILEKIFDTVEANSSETQIASEDSVLNIHKALDPSIVYEVYEYWLSKRTSYATTSGCLGVGGLIPRVRTECRKDAQGSVNPYVAFRRRAEKMQTRKNRKNDEDNYEKILKLVHDFSKAQQLFNMTTRREKLKLAMIDHEAEILSKRMQLTDFGVPSIYNDFMERLRTGSGASGSSPTKPLSQLNGASVDEAKKKKKAKRTKISVDRDIVSKAWLKKNVESWNRPPTLFNGTSVTSAPNPEKPKQTAYVDGRYTFKRRRGCVYRAALPVLPTPQQPTVQTAPQIPPHLRFYETILPSSNGSYRSIGYARRRIGRGGRVLFERLPRDIRPPNPGEQIDPFDEANLIDTSRVFRARLHPFADLAEDEEETPTAKFFARSNRTRFNDEHLEREWVSKYQGSWSHQRDDNNANNHEDVHTSSRENDDSEVEKMHVDGNEDDAQINDSKTRIVNGNGNGNENHHHHRDKNEDEDMDVDEVVDRLRHATGGKAVPLPQNSRSGNGTAGRVGPTPVPAKMCGTVSDSDDWREPSGSPSESNSSTEWNGFATDRVSVGYQPKMMGVDDEVPSPARPGDHPAAAKPASIKEFCDVNGNNSGAEQQVHLTILDRNVE
ncbi:unnamed protein product [Caenorhabditis bovis]|uniref:Enhancer of polycomb-like protein n=1 Tax=Caenorhabditis bovis TaxID=2654633 RepID=A0A8S1EPC7_9PELO|nr:unnamed protein product [Caenorhabditis bovis]